MQRCSAGSLSCAATVGWARVIVTSCFVAWVSDLGNTWLAAAAWFRRTEKSSQAQLQSPGSLRPSLRNEWEIHVFTAVPDLVRAQTRNVSQNIRTVLLCSVGFMLHTSKKKPRGNFLKGEFLSKEKKKNLEGNWMNLTHIKPDCFTAVWVELITVQGSLLVWWLTLDARLR